MGQGEIGLDFVRTIGIRYGMAETQKPKRDPLVVRIPVRVSESEKLAFEQAAANNGSNLSQWIRQVCRDAIRRMKK